MKYTIKNDKLTVDANSIKSVHDKLISFIKDFFKDKNGPAILGVSGGKDSTICAALLAEALGPEKVIGVMMPNGEQKDIDDSKRVCELLKITPVTIDIGSAYDELTNQIECYRIYKFNKAELPELYTTNTPARLRMTTLYGIAAVVGGFVCNTCNFSEDYIGYSTKYGDCAGDFSLLNKLTVTEVLALGDYMKLPREFVHKAPSDGMCGKTDEDNLGFSYEDLDKYILLGMPPKSKEVFEKIERMHENPNTGYKLVPMAAPDWM